jgi:hypothetical protein
MIRLTRRERHVAGARRDTVKTTTELRPRSLLLPGLMVSGWVAAALIVVSTNC